MAIQKTEAIVLKNSSFGETSLLATFYTRDFGKIRGIVKGIKRPDAKTKFTGSLEPFSYNEIIFYERMRSGLHLISQCDLKDIFAPIRQDIEKTAYASYFIELMDSVTQLHDKNEELLKLILDSLELLSHENEELRKIVRIFEIKLLKISGFMPKLDSCVHCGNRIYTLKTNNVGSQSNFSSSRFSQLLGGLLCGWCIGEDKSSKPILKGTIASINYIEKADWKLILRFKAAREVAEELEVLLKNFLNFHLEKKLKSTLFLEKINQ